MYLGLVIVLQVGSLFVDNVCEEHYKRAHQFYQKWHLKDSVLYPPGPHLSSQYLMSQTI